MSTPVRPGGSPMILRSACDGSCGQTYVFANLDGVFLSHYVRELLFFETIIARAVLSIGELINGRCDAGVVVTLSSVTPPMCRRGYLTRHQPGYSTRSSKPRHHYHHNHDHHHRHEIHHVQYDNVRQRNKQPRLIDKQQKHLDSTREIDDFESSLKEVAGETAAISSQLEFNSISGPSGLHFADHHRFTEQTDFTVASGLENHLGTESRLNSKVSEYSAQEEMSRSEPYVRSTNANGSRLRHHDTRSSSRRLIGLEETSDSEWSDNIHVASSSRTVSGLFSQTNDRSLDVTCSETRSGFMSWFWLYVWKTVYFVISNVILFDTWLLSRTWMQWLRRHWVLMLLAVPLLLLFAWTAVEKTDLSDLPKPGLWSFFDWQCDQPPLCDKPQASENLLPQEVPAYVPPIATVLDDVLEEKIQHLKVEIREMKLRYDGAHKALQSELDRLQETVLGIRKSDAELAEIANVGILSSLNKVGESEKDLVGFHTWIRKQIVVSSAWAEAHERLVRDTRTATADVKLPAVNCVGCSDTQILKIVHDALAVYDADKTGLADYALESAGGSVVSTRCSETYNTRSALVHLFGIPLWYLHNSARTAIQPDTNPGDCWAFKGSEGRLVIQLATTIVPTAFSLEHIPRSLSLDGTGDTAPKDFSVWGLLEESDAEGTLLGSYTYDRDGEPLQRFMVDNDQTGPFHLVELRIHSNHGRIEYTCLYRFRVHGVPVQQRKP